MGEISEALRRARGTPERAATRDGIASEHLSKRVEKLPDSARPEAAAAIAPSAEQTAGHRHNLDRGRKEGWEARAVVVSRHSPVAESCRHVALKVRAELGRRSLRSVAVTGPLRNEGKTTIACNLALALASMSRGREVALVDLDLRRPSIAADFQIPVAHGIEDFLKGTCGLSEICFTIEKPAVDVYPAASPHAAAHELLVQSSFVALVRALEERYAAVIIDTPPALLVPDTSLILAQVGAFILVARCGATRERALGTMLDQLPRDQFLGTILNEGPLPTHSKQYGYYGGDLASLEEEA